MNAFFLYVVILVSFCVSIAFSFLAETFIVQRIPIVGTWIGLEIHKNSGFAFGISLPEPLQTFLIFFALFMVVFISLNQIRGIWLHIAFGLIIGGATGNIVDRILDGFVTDFFQIGSFPVFNMADSSITMGAAMLFWEYVKNTCQRDRSTT